MTTDVFYDRIEEYIELVRSSLTELDERLSVMTGEEINPNSNSDEIVTHAIELGLVARRHSFLNLVDSEEQLGKVASGIAWVNGDVIPVYDGSEYPLLEVDTRTTSAVIHILNVPSAAETGGELLYIKDKYGTFDKNPCKVIFGPLKPGGTQDGTWDIVGDSDANTTARYTLREPGVTTAVSVQELTYTGAPANTKRAFVYEGIGSILNRKYTPTVVPLPEHNGKVVTDSDGGMTIYGSSPADSTFRPWDVDIGDRILSSFLVSTTGIDPVSGDIDPTIKTGKTRWAAKQTILNSWDDSDPDPVDRRFATLKNDFRLELDLRRNTTPGELRYVNARVFDAAFNLVSEGDWSITPGVAGSNFPDGSFTTDEGKIKHVIVSEIVDGAHPNDFYMADVYVFIEFENTVSGRKDIGYLKAYLELENAAVIGSQFKWEITEPVTALYTIKANTGAVDRPYTISKMFDNSGIELSVFKDVAGTIHLESWVFRTSNDSFWQSAGLYGDLPLTGITTLPTMEELSVSYGYYRPYHAIAPRIFINNGGTLMTSIRRTNASTVYQYVEEGGFTGEVNNIHFGTPSEIEIDSKLRTGGKSCGTLVVGDGYVKYFYYGVDYVAVASIPNLIDAVVVDGLNEDHVYALTSYDENFDRIYIYSLPDYNPSMTDDVPMTLLETVLVEKDAILQEDNALNDGLGYYGVVVKPSEELFSISEAVISEKNNSEFFWRAHFMKKIGDNHGT